MNLRKYFPKKERFVIEGREVILINKTKLDFPSKLRNVILLFCRTEKIAWSLPRVFFSLESWDGALAKIDESQMEKEKLIININAERIYGSESEQHWRRIIAHELTHLFHDYLSGTIRRYYRTSKRLDRALSEVQKRMEVDLAHDDLRVLYFRLFRKIFTEGIAKYYENLKMGITVISEDHFQDIYETEKEDLNYVKEKLALALNEILKLSSNRKSSGGLSNSFVELLKRHWYSTGYHMVYTILFVDHKTNFEQVLHFQPFEFIRKYEECMVIKGLQPVISVTSGKGILDYKTLLAELTAAVKELQRRSGK